MGRPNINVNIINGKSARNKHSGTSEERPVEGMSVGFLYFDTTIDKPIWWNGNDWVCADGSNPDSVTSEEVNDNNIEE